MDVSGLRNSWDTFATKLRRESSMRFSSAAMRLMESPSSWSSPPQLTLTRRVRSPLVNSATADLISRSGLIWLWARKKASTAPTSSASSASGMICRATVRKPMRSSFMGMCRSTAPTTMASSYHQGTPMVTIWSPNSGNRPVTRISSPVWMAESCSFTASVAMDSEVFQLLSRYWTVPES